MASHSDAFAGDFQPYSRIFAHWAIRQLVLSRSLSPFIVAFDGVPCLIRPKVFATLVKLTAFYAPKRALSVARVRQSTTEELVEDWRSYCRAFVSVSIDPQCVPSLVPENFNATRNARSEIEGYGWCALPSLAEIDCRLDTVLEVCEVKPFERAWSAANEARDHC